MRRLPLFLAFAAALLLSGCLEAKLVATQDLPLDVPWTAPEAAHYNLLDRDNGKQLGEGTLEIAGKDSQYDLSLKFQDGEDFDNSTVLVDGTTLKPISSHRDRSVGGKTKELRAEYNAATDVVTITEVKSSGDRAVPHRLKDNYYDNDTSLFLWRALKFVEGFTANYRTVVTGSGEQQVVHLEVKRKERVTVPAGTFDTWRLEIQAEGRRQVAWYADTPERTLVQYDNSIQFFQLISLPS
jgi:hypothetical protein